MTQPHAQRTTVKRPGDPGRPSSRDSVLSANSKVTSCLDTAVRNSPADETEILWLESRRRRCSHQVEDADHYDRLQTTVQVRVREGQRTGLHRCGRPSAGELEQAIRHALAQATTQQRESCPPMPGPDEPAPTRIHAYDNDIACLTEHSAPQFLGEHAGGDDAAILEWAEGLVVLLNSHGLRRTLRVTSAYLQVRSGIGAGAGFATGAARQLESLQADRVFERARRRRANGAEAPPPSGAVPLLLSPEAMIELVELLNRNAFGARAYRLGSFVREHCGVQVFDRSLNLDDDGTNESGLAFPFDLEGKTKSAVPLIAGGVPKTPTVDLRSAAEFGVEPTSHCVSGQEAFGLNLFMQPGESSDDELLRMADGGLWISRLEHLECFDSARVLIRARARGVRRIADGQMVHPVPDLIWEDSLLRVFSELTGIGQNTALRVTDDGILGGISAPAVVVGETSAVRPA